MIQSNEVIARFERYAALPERETALELLTVLALAQSLRITHWSEQAVFLGRAPSGRTWSNMELRPYANELIAHGLVSESNQGLRPAFGVSNLVLRWATPRPRFERMLRAAGMFMSDERSALRVAVITADPKAEGWLRSLTQGAPAIALDVAGSLANAPYDAVWLKRQPVGVRALLVELALRNAEAIPAPHSELLEGLFGADPPVRLEELTSTALLSLAGLALLRGDVKALGRMSAHPACESIHAELAAASVLAEGAIERGGHLAAALDLTQRPGPGALHLLLWLAARGVARADVKALTGAARQRSLFAGSYKAAQRWAIGGKRGLYQTREADLLLGIFAAVSLLDDPDDPPMHSYELGGWWAQWRRVAESLEQAGYAWLAAQHVAAGAATSARCGPHAQLPIDPPHATMPLIGMASRNVRWELDLARLEALAIPLRPTQSAAGGESTSTVRIAWRVSPRGAEPWLQTVNAKRGTWTAGRKLAMQHLFDPNETTRSIPPEDQRVARHVRQVRYLVSGYPQTEYCLDEGGLFALVGHPRVHWGDEPAPREVVSGKVKLRVEEEDGGLHLSAEPMGLGAGAWFQLHEGRIVLYQVGKDQAALLERLGRGLRFPTEGRARLMGLVTSLSNDFAVDTSAEAPARAVIADARIWLRLVPHATGLSVRVATRPLGGHGPHCVPGVGVARVIATLEGEPRQAERNLEAERAALAALLEACPFLDAWREEDCAYRIDDPSDALALVSAIAGLGEAVHVEWPHGQPLRLRGRATRAALLGAVRLEGGWLEVDARLDLGGGEDLVLQELVKLLADRPGRFVRLSNGDYLELEDGLRTLVEGLGAATSKGKKGLLLPRAAVSLIDQLGEAQGVRFDAPATKWRDSIERVFRKTPAVPRGLQAELRSYQVDGYRWLSRLAELELGACLADDMGLGKTVQIIALLLQRAKGGPALVIAPTSVCDNWQREIERFAPSLRVRLFTGVERSGQLDGLAARDVVVTSYALLALEAEALGVIAWETAVLDEAQLIKNADTQRARAAFALRAKTRVVATGTPIENRVGDLVSLFRFLHPGLLDEAAGRASAATSGLTRELRRLSAPFLLRRTKAQVLDDLPPISEIQRTVTLSREEATLYEEVRRQALAKLAKSGKSQEARIQIFAELTRLRRLCCHPELVAPKCGLPSSKLESFLELVSELKEGNHRALVFSQFTDVLALVRAELDQRNIGYQYLDGSTPPKARTRAVDAFQSGEGDVFLISLRAGGFGLNLTGADYVIHLDPWWNPAVESQATDRAHRIGQTRPVTVYRLVTEGTIESRIVALHKEKRALADAVLADADQSIAITAEDLRGLLEV